MYSPSFVGEQRILGALPGRRARGFGLAIGDPTESDDSWPDETSDENCRRVATLRAPAGRERLSGSEERLMVIRCNLNAEGRRKPREDTHLVFYDFWC